MEMAVLIAGVLLVILMIAFRSILTRRERANLGNGATTQPPSGQTSKIIPPGNAGLQLYQVGPRKIEVIKIIRQHTGRGLKESKMLADQTPSVLAQQAEAGWAQSFAAALKNAGANVELLNDGADDGFVLDRSAASERDALIHGHVTVILLDPGRNKINAIKIIREYTGLGLAEAKALTDQTPSVVVQALNATDAALLKQALEDAGATVQIR